MKLKLFTRTNADTTKTTLAMYWHEITRDKRRLLTYAILQPLSKLTSSVILPLLFSLIIQSLILQPQDFATPLWLLVGGVLAAIFTVVTNHIALSALFKHEENMATALANKAMSGLLSHSYQFFANRKVGSLAGDFTGFWHGVIAFLDQIFLHAIAIAVNFVASLVVIAFLAPTLLAPLLLLTVLVVWRSLVAVNKRSVWRNQRKAATSKLNGQVADILGNQLLVRMFARERFETDSVVAQRQHIESIATEEIKVINRETNTRQTILYTFQILTIGGAVWLFYADLVSIAGLIFAVTYLGRVTASLFEITPIIRNLENAFLAAAPMTEILSEHAEILDKKDAKSLHITDGAVAFENVSFWYEDAKHGHVFKNLSLQIQPGEKVGVAGPSGGGKTTLTKLLLRFIDVQAGKITIDGQALTDVTQQSLRSSIAYVPQEPLLFHRTLRENIAYGKPEASDEEIFAAVKRAHAEDFVSKLPHGLDTVVGERGIKLSGGQRQRVAIARAILKDAPILVLDEATSALDSESEHLVQQALDELMQNRTTIVVAHRLSTIQKMDRILVFKDGTISEQGNHETLLEKNGLYKKLWTHQSGGFIED